jgi:3-hydroxyisobutyrate dehydrogenase-like beta-hydroxyacid dehydrogenase
MADDRTIGFVGLGGMGAGVVKNLAQKGFAVRVYDLDASKIETAVAQGAVAASSALDAAKGVDVFALCVTTAEVVEEILAGKNGVLKTLKPNSIILDHTTVNPGHVARMNALCGEHGMRYAEAPMTRTPIHAQQGCVNILYGGAETILADLRAIFDCYAENIFHVGPSGHGIRLKLIHNFIAFANVASFCEGFALAAKEGLDMDKVIGIISAAGGKSGMMDLYGESTLQRDFEPKMSLDNAKKDVKYYADWLEQAGLPAGLADAVYQTYDRASQMGHGDESCTAVIKPYEDVSGVIATLPKGRS